ncbi:MAG TPA: peptide-methionine (S)-S-oxide reductase MsrA [Afifellaceae bacterium]|nr:peptide-methionine (S)-S-oxide reductase MsrA [Afifellaceae bacterium]
MVRLSFAWIAAALALGGAALAQEARQPGGQTTQAVFAGGCFWCVEEAFDAVSGVVETVSGYTGGHVENPTYRQVTFGDTGHYEAVEVTYDPAQVSYEELLDTFWRNVDPFDARGQFCDKGSSYRSAIFVAGEEERRQAEATKKAVEERFGETVATEILPAAAFYPAEDYHQNYYQENPARYRFYKWNCGRAQRLEEIWGPKPS